MAEQSTAGESPVDGESLTADESSRGEFIELTRFVETTFSALELEDNVKKSF